jgi:hypothetical protein
MSHEEARELIRKWELAYKKMEHLPIEEYVTEEFNTTASTIIWTLVQLKTAGYQLSDTDCWYHPAELN